MQRIYFDHSATTPVHPEVTAVMLEYLSGKFGNPSSVHSYGREARSAVDAARRQVAALIGAAADEIFFTSGGTEADNLALKGVAYANRSRGNHIITSAIEHHAILHTCDYLSKQGFDITYLPVDRYGMVSVESVAAAIREQTILISIMYANNEVGTLQPISEIGALARQRGIFFHTDATQAVGHWPVDVAAENIDLLTMAGHKFNAPKGVGALYIRRGVKLEAVQQGGGHERNMRAGTENVPGIVALGKAAEIARRDMPRQIAHLQEMRTRLIEQVLATIPQVQLNGHPVQRMPGSANFSFDGIEGESLLLNLDLAGIAVSSGSACTAGATEPSHVLLAMGLSREAAAGSLRISMGLGNTAADVDYFLTVLTDIVGRLRSLSPQDTAPPGQPFAGAAALSQPQA